MKLRTKQSATVFHLCLSALVLFVLSLLFVSNIPRAEAQVQGGRLITVHDRGVETTFVSAEATVSEALEAQGITLDEKDAVEPARDEKLVATDYQVNIYRARPVTIVDGALRQRVITAYQTPEQIIAEAGIKLYSEDGAALSRSSDIIGDGAGLQLAIDRAVPLTLDLYGTKTTIRTQAETVGDMLAEKSIELGDAGRTSVPLSTSITEGMSVTVWREGKQTITKGETVKFSTKEIEDADRPVGYESVQTEGKNGARTVTYEIEIRNGKEVARKEIASITTKEPVQKVVVVGTKPKTVPYTGGGSKSEWLAASNIPQESWGYADFMVTRESGWNPNAVNASSGACGLAQALPCSKLGPNWNNPIVALNWMNDYVNGRYGSWEGAYAFWQANHWY